MSILAHNPNEWLCSNLIAGSININPVVVRRELIVLKEHGLIVSQQGKEGGVRLSKDAKEISLADIFRVINNSDILGRKNPNPNVECFIGKEINNKLDILFRQTHNIVCTFLESISLAEFALQFKADK